MPLLSAMPHNRWTVNELYKMSTH